jgi:hypothetical protein
MSTAETVVRVLIGLILGALLALLVGAMVDRVERSYRFYRDRCGRGKPDRWSRARDTGTLAALVLVAVLLYSLLLWLLLDRVDRAELTSSRN